MQLGAQALLAGDKLVKLVTESQKKGAKGVPLRLTPEMSLVRPIVGSEDPLAVARDLIAEISKMKPEVMTQGMH